ncbi:ATP-dependent helicase/nuclease subunit A [Legionella massiliensis]|uniref:DNA 3'-5' helicase n=1 Tax=Legionella massiliensis TaxID=1034943 RepID=A0A078KVS1_9GAMM|nr:UvrD-helicase domain-containing protein [Legionella massiliensis]CDZ78530.1 ATP-dependent helicase/nuclease subunit A [Legionella massiliensis]CEE14268.1 ATP-dependent helicase/nuclease subunit A [Legionella massiliensis]
MLKDSLQRAQATDPARSFIVQAPAGSGKTEILTQRFLRLLGTVNAPEQIVALTFTRKAASEMRERIVLSLQKVAAGQQANSPHQQQTYDYAAAALARSEERNWQLLQQSGRLRIITIDSLCQMLSQAIPLHEKQIPYAQISDNPQDHYKKAARACFAYALADKDLQSPLKTLLIHLDNRQDKLLQLFSDLLAKRDQWLPALYSARQHDKARFEQMLVFIEQHELSRFQDSISFVLWDELCSLASKVTSIEADPEKPRFLLRDWQDPKQINRTIATGLASLLLTSDDKLRKGFDHHVGLKKEACDAQLLQALKSQSKELLGKLAEQADFLEALLSVKNLPPPYYDPEQWQVLQALFTLLPFLVGHLQLIFNEQNEVDFAAVAQQALDALGDEEQPTDLALYLDNSIHHLLVDEFQDTSIQQFQLLTKLVQGWQANEGKTLFVVGDPMQSIYRFRQAEVGLFLKAKQQGIGPVELESLELCCNFRSTATIVNWVNQQFKSIFPQNDDIESGAISFHASVNVQESAEDSYIKAWQFADRAQEAQALVKLAAEVLAKHPEEQIAILVRSRGLLAEIMTALREQKIPFQGVDIELLAKLSHLRDLWSLTQALLLPANRLAWLELLRSPFCGLALADLHLIANFDKKKSIYYALSKLDRINTLSAEGKVRGQFIYSVMHEALVSRHQQAIVDWVASTFKRLHGELILDSTQQEDLEQFWLLLEDFTQVEELPDLKELKEEFDKLYSQRATPSRLQIMTIHKSKGLEFDSVILPGLGSKSQSRDQPLLRWMKLPSKNHGELLLISPIKAAYREECRVYNYLGKLDAEKESYELQRLFYVAATRAKKRLFLFDSSEKEGKGTFRSLLKNQEFSSIEATLSKEETTQNLPLLYRLPQEIYLSSTTHSHQAVIPAQAGIHQGCSTVQPLEIDSRLRGNDNSPKFNDPPRTAQQSILVSLNRTARQQGIVAHELLQWICDHHPATIDALPWAMVENQFKRLGFNAEERSEACNLLRQQISRMFSEPIGQWLSKAHQDERNEYELLVNVQGSASTRIIDRTFISEGERWIIDFKTGSEEEGAQNQHRQQVNNYAELLASNSPEPIRCGLYYLTSGNWVQWDYQ